jgi:hypothetical protein
VTRLWAGQLGFDSQQQLGFFLLATAQLICAQETKCKLDIYISVMRSEVFMAVMFQVKVFWVMMPYVVLW